jgi:hypothetical protein
MMKVARDTIFDNFSANLQSISHAHVTKDKRQASVSLHSILFERKFRDFRSTLEKLVRAGSGCLQFEECASSDLSFLW